MRRIRVLLADDHPAFRAGLCRLLQDERDLEVVGEASNGEEAVKLASELQPDVAIIDVAMPQVNGIEATKQIRAVCPGTAVLMVSAYGYESYVLASLRAGAVGYLLKTTPIRELVNAVHLLHAGEAVFDLRATSGLLTRLVADQGDKEGAAEQLQHRELQVLKLVAKGMSNKEIAGTLAISERTVQTHLVNVFRKLRVGSRTGAVLHAMKKGWLGLDDLAAKGS